MKTTKEQMLSESYLKIFPLFKETDTFLIFQGSQSQALYHVYENNDNANKVGSYSIVDEGDFYMLRNMPSRAHTTSRRIKKDEFDNVEEVHEWMLKTTINTFHFYGAS